ARRPPPLRNKKKWPFLLIEVAAGVSPALFLKTPPLPVIPSVAEESEFTLGEVEGTTNRRQLQPLLSPVGSRVPRGTRGGSGSVFNPIH
ncbi:MAG: hypothetical protein WA005_06015, partial [Candidatus Binataceae bacterium]